MMYIYITTNLLNNKKYIGQHQGELNDNYLGSGKLLIQSIQKYGKENFQKEILEICESKESLNRAEAKWIDFYDAINNENFYNLVPGGTGGNTYQYLTEEEKQRIKRLKSEQTRGVNSPRYGVKLSQETKMKISDTLKKFGAMKGENNPNYGKTGKDNPQAIKIYAIMNGKKVPFYGVREASRITGIPSPNISRSLTSFGKFSAGKDKSNNRIYWFYLEEE